MTDTEEKNICPNCEKEFDKSFNYCPYCGQKNEQQPLRLKHFISDYFSANFNFDSKIWLTLKYLITRPAFLTQEYFKGKRIRYIPPVRLYLFISLIYFFIFSLTLSSPSASDGDKLNADSTSIFAISVDKDLKEGTKLDSIRNSSAFDKYLIEKLEEMDTKVGEEKFYQNLQKYISTGMFLLLPLIALILSAVFYKKKYYIENLMFVIHLQSLIFLIAIVFNLIDLVWETEWMIFIEVVILLYTSFVWMKRFYGLSIMQTTGRQILFYIAYAILFAIYLISILTISILFI